MVCSSSKETVSSSSVLFVLSLPPGIDELSEEQLSAQGTPGVLGMAATARQTVGVHHVVIGQRVYLQGQGRDQQWRAVMGASAVSTEARGLAPWA